MAEFSKVTIQFLIDYDIDYDLRLTTETGGTTSSQLWSWVATRSAAFEVTKGTPTGTAGERTALNFKAAFDLDNPSNFITSTTSNSIEIISETEGINFVGFNTRGAEALLAEGVDFNITFDNYVAPLDLTEIDFALVRSPHYINIPFFFVTTQAANVDVFVWDGDVAAPPTEPTYSLTIPRPTIDFEEFNINISDLVSESIEARPTIDLSSTIQIVDSANDSVKWVKYTASYVDDRETIADIEGLFIASDGYGYYNEGVNPTKPTNDILTSCINRNVHNLGFIMFPFVNNGTNDEIEATISNSSSGETLTEDVTVSNFSNDAIQYLEIDVSSIPYPRYNKITITYGGVDFVYNIIQECLYTPIQVLFKNKYGVFDFVTLFKKSSKSISVKNEDFVNNFVSGGAYDITRHQKQKLNVLGNEKITTNSGYVSEDNNELFKQLLLSDLVYFYENDNLIPVNVASSNINFKTQLNDKLINYTIDFDYAYNTIQNV